MVLNEKTPALKKDRNHEVIQDSYQDRAFKGDYTGTNLIYRGYAKPGTLTTAASWQICKLTYSTSNVTDIQWPLNAGGIASSNYEFIWDNRASYTYA